MLELSADSLPKTSKPVIFCGNASVASQVSDKYDVTYIDTSAETLEEVQSQYPGIRKLVKADVLDYIYFNASSSLIISSKISANWLHSFQLEKLIKAIEINNYDFVQLELIDAEAIMLKDRLELLAINQSDKWNLEKLMDKKHSSGHFVAEVESDSEMTSGKDSKVKLGSYNKESLLCYLKDKLPKYKVEIQPSLIPSDPSFNIVIRK